jgi:hypothetical protein
MRPTIVLLCTFLVSCGREQWREADMKLNESAQAARDSGFAPMAGPHNTFGTFQDSGSATWRVHLEAHQPYFIAAGCTEGCSDLHFAIREPHGETVATDSAAARSAPRLVFTAAEEGDYQIAIQHGRCAVSECRYVAQIYSKRATP